MSNKTKILYEDSRSQLMSKSQSADNYTSTDLSLGKNRFQRRLHSKYSTSVRDYNRIDMNRLFKDNILDVNIEVIGETDKYTVKVSFGGFLDALQDQLKSNNNTFDWSAVLQALRVSFNGDNVYINCDCPDFYYRFGYWTTKNNTNSGFPETRPSDITNPNDTKGTGCKHCMLVLSNSHSWLMKVASVIHNYVNYMEVHKPYAYAKIIYPAIYNQPYQEPVQQELSFDDETQDLLDTDQETIDIVNKWAKAKNQFKIGNEYRFRPMNKVRGQLAFDDLMSDSEPGDDD